MPRACSGRRAWWWRPAPAAADPLADVVALATGVLMHRYSLPRGEALFNAILRKIAKLTADDVLYSYNRLADPKRALPGAEQILSIKGAAEVQAIGKNLGGQFAQGAATAIGTLAKGLAGAVDAQRERHARQVDQADDAAEIEEVVVDTDARQAEHIGEHTGDDFLGWQCAQMLHINKD